LIAATCLNPGARFGPQVCCRQSGGSCPPLSGASAPGSAPRRLAGTLRDLLGDGSPAPVAARAADAARGFSAGNCYLSGGMVDRFI
jgi:hypothetical protein